MQQYIVLLRGINVGGHRKIKMADLRQLLADVGYSTVQTYIQSGNILLTWEGKDVDLLVQNLTTLIKEQYGFAVPVIVRTVPTMRAVLSRHPYSDQEPAKLLVTFLSKLPLTEKIAAIETDFISSTDKFKIIGQEIYLYCPNGYGKSKLTNDFWERKLAVQATTRNWKTTNKLVAMCIDK